MTDASYDAALFERLRTLSPQGHEPANSFRFVSPDEVAGPDALPSAEAVTQGRVGIVVLAGGMATRFGGVAKAAVELWPGMTLLDVKLSLARGLARRLGARLPAVVVVSDATERAVSELIARRSFEPLRIATLSQTLMPRILPNGALATNPDGQPDLCPPGHGEVLGLLARHGQGLAPGVDYWMVSNIDNILAGPDEGVLAAHLHSAAAASVEVVEGKAADTGGYLVRSGGRMRILEGFQVAEADRPGGRFLFSTNSFVLGPPALASHAALPFHAVRKESGGRAVVQFEQLLGDVGLIGVLNPVRVPRDGPGSRFVALKTRETFDAAKEPLRKLVEIEARMTENLQAFARTVIVGNGGSGKSWLAERLGAAIAAPVTDLDEIHWLPGGFNARREPAAAVEMVRARAAEDRWIIEGVYGWLANAALPRATALIWVDIPIDECIANARARGPRRGGDEAAFEALIAFIADYATRTNANSRTAHEQAFEAFAGDKVRIASREDMANLLGGQPLR